MMTIGPAGTFASPTASRPEPEADCFRAGDVWENSRGTPFRVMEVRQGVAHMVNENTSRTYHRKADDLGWKTGHIWVRVSCGS